MVGDDEGLAVGLADGAPVGVAVGFAVGFADGPLVGAGVGTTYVYVLKSVPKSDQSLLHVLPEFVE
jgi:hypothetical protein